MKLAKEDKFIIKLIKTQLENDWRKPLLKTLDNLLKNTKNFTYDTFSTLLQTLQNYSQYLIHLMQQG